MYLSVCLSICLSVCLSIYLSTHLSIYPSIIIYPLVNSLQFHSTSLSNLSILSDLSILPDAIHSTQCNLSKVLYRIHIYSVCRIHTVQLSIYLSIYLSINLPTYLPTYLSIYLSIYPCIYLSMYLSICTVYLRVDLNSFAGFATFAEQKHL